MKVLLHQLIQASSKSYPQHIALQFKDRRLSYLQLDCAIGNWAEKFSQQIKRFDRVAIYLPKSIENVVSFFSISACGATFVPINPLLKPAQVEYILADCKVKVLLTTYSRLKQLLPVLHTLKQLELVLLTDQIKANQLVDNLHFSIQALQLDSEGKVTYPKIDTIDTDNAAILYTSGSTGKPKGVVLSHRNMMCGAAAVANYLKHSPEDRILAVLPFSFDYGFSQLSSSFYIGARVVLLEYLLPRDVIKAVAKYEITGLAAVPPLWIQLAQLEWPEEAKNCLRYITNSGGTMPTHVLQALRKELPNTSPFLMYGLTEAFRSTYLNPEYLDSHPTSIGKAIPNAEILVLRSDGTQCHDNEPGELVHRGSLVAQGYWNNPQATSAVFKPFSHQQLPVNSFQNELAVFSGDQVYRDPDGFLYFVHRQDEMIKTSGYRVSPNEIEEICFLYQPVKEAVALGIPHPRLGQAIAILLVTDKAYQEKELLALLKQQLPNFMQPGQILIKDKLPRNPNGKIDRKGLANKLKNLFQTS